ncbi:MAG: hypothetical protein ACTHOU_06715 [Aureliella sp.]
MQNDELYRSLERYLATASELLDRWGQWLDEHQRHVLGLDVAAMESHAESAAGLQQELGSLGQRRTEVLSAARELGLECATLKQLAQRLPQWRSVPDFPNRIHRVERSMAGLRRLNTAAWMLVSQRSRLINETMLLMTSGSTLQGAYIETPHADTYGGQLLDTEA